MKTCSMGCNPDQVSLTWYEMGLLMAAEQLVIVSIVDDASTDATQDHANQRHLHWEVILQDTDLIVATLTDSSLHANHS
jgi:hypothetical protein